MRVHITPGPVSGTVAVPPSKSMAHRAVICSALAHGRSTLYNLEYSKDITATIGAMRQLCARIEQQGDSLQVEGVGGWHTVTRPVDCCESGSTLRLLWPLFSLTNQKITFTGRGKLMQRPLSVYEKIAADQKLRFARDPDAGTTSLWGQIRPGVYDVPGNLSSQFISGLLLALPLLEQGSVIRIAPPFESRSYVQLTLAAMQAFGVTALWQNETTLAIPGGQKYTPADYTVEGDYSNAAFFAVLGAVKGGITVTGLAPDSLQGDAVILDILQRAGAKFTRSGDAVSFEAAQLQGVTVDLADCPDLGPILMVLGALAMGETTLVNAGRLRIKESDRIAAMEEELRKFGVDIASTADTVKVRGTTAAGLHAPTQTLYDHIDHRVVMSLTVLALAGGFAADIEGAQAVQKSWPAFFEAAKQLGAKVETTDG